MILLKESKKVIRESDEANRAIPEGIIPIAEAAKRPAFKNKKAMTTYEYEIPEIYPKVKIVIDDELTGYNPD